MELKTKICTKCKQRKFLIWFGKCKARKDGLQPQCKTCKRDYYQKYYKTHKNKHHECQRRHRQTFIGCLRYRFADIKQRCNNLKHNGYKNWGGRGIKCLFKNADEFVDYVINKLKVDPRGLHTDRIDNNGNYEPGNIRFVTQAENNRNQRKRK